ncbi:MAG: hypothetical protein ACRBCS_06330 [Cellvibrionaceae bacterium]
MDPILKTLFILIVVFGSIIGSRYIQHKTKIFEMKLKSEKEFSSGLKIELEDIKSRLATLEAIITDKGYEIKRSTVFYWYASKIL